MAPRGRAPNSEVGLLETRHPTPPTPKENGPSPNREHYTTPWLPQWGLVWCAWGGGARGLGHRGVIDRGRVDDNTSVSE